nr:MAG TPA: hypothetical protein [Caudoviricetes sp.]
MSLEQTVGYDLPDNYNPGLSEGTFPPVLFPLEFRNFSPYFD